MNARGVVAHIKSARDYEFTAAQIEKFYAAVFVGGERAELAHELDPVLAAAMAKFAETHRAPEIEPTPLVFVGARERRLARRGRTLWQLMGGA